MKSYTIKNAHVDCDKNTYEILNDSIVKPLTEVMKILMNKDMCVLFMWNEDNKLIIKYSKEKDINKLCFNKIIKIPTCILISDDLASFTTVVEM